MHTKHDHLHGTWDIICQYCKNIKTKRFDVGSIQIKKRGKQVYGGCLSRQTEILAASDRMFSLVNVRNDALDYARTCREWVQRIEAAKPELIAMVGADKTNEYVQYLRMPAAACARQQFGLLGLKFRSYANACPPRFPRFLPLSLRG